MAGKRLNLPEVFLEAAPALRKLVPKRPTILYTLYTGAAVEQELQTIRVAVRTVETLAHEKGERRRGLRQLGFALLGARATPSAPL